MAKQKKKSFGAEIIEGLTELKDALQNREPIEKRFTVRTVQLNLRPREYDAESVRLTRLRLGASQAVFAELVGVSAATVEAWEQGARSVNATVRRLLDEINRDPKRWVRLLREAVKEKKPA